MSSIMGEKSEDQKPLSYSVRKKRDYSLGISLLNDTNEDIVEFIKNRVEEYRIHDYQGDDFGWDFYDDFKEFTTPESFLRAGTEPPRRLRDILRKKGVFIPKDKKSIAGNLVALLSLNEPPTWPSTDKEYERIMELEKKEFPLKYKSTKPIKEARYFNVKESGKIEKSSDAMESRGPLHQIRQDTTLPLPAYPSNSIEDQSLEYDEYRISNYHPHGFSQELSTLTKLYNDCSKYSGNGDSFDYKFDIFLRQCENTNIPRNGLKNDYPIMLKDALYYYYNFFGNEKKFSLESMCKIFKDKFEGVEHKRTLLNNWNKLNFEIIKNRKENTGKNMVECV
ncbi:hypothetical protein GcM3_007049 [Golovinomyces cichoracearum]|uniref:Uncharacterized protein n=1 Tax=Golovinomyces cichoracearum TaxID=62708 RepID=A0A420JAK2_9PEZI|nr:hypothetical protein GcM3_007049 [Golovinomyces cichoracearum]